MTEFGKIGFDKRYSVSTTISIGRPTLCIAIKLGESLIFMTGFVPEIDHIIENLRQDMSGRTLRKLALMLKNPALVCNGDVALVSIHWYTTTDDQS